ncbi:MAG: tRNA uridine-5-carboxymethylaminomethyl(34) synthesis GTPase MnmE [Clostridia bacterium]|nr:tRNA uridine-5-carboxymethylaminomethyl(34) synthesis GTPase MnmE [Clostridia bacterium]
MLKVNIDDTIAAISTATGNGGIGIVRLSGSEAVEICDKIFVSPKGKKLSQQKSHTIHFGNIVYEGKIIDEVLVSVMRAPNTYTREDVVEINTHGGYRAVTAVLNTVIKSGARMAEPGEFTKRAFLNGRIDLTQAEAVIDIINAKTDASREAAMLRLEGRLSKEIRNVREDILMMLAHIEAGIDYPEHDDEAMTYNLIADNTKKALKAVDRLISSADTGKIYKEGIKTVILGRPNVGKSSLLNAMLEEDRAIVTDIPGTTRDSLEEMLNVNGIPLNIIDTAGIRNTDDVIEQIGVEKSKSLAEQADLILLMFDGSRELSSEDRELIDLVKNKKTITLINKLDLEQKIDIEALNELEPVNISVKSDMGINDIYERIKEMFSFGDININNEVLISGERNKESLFKAKRYLENVMETVENRMPEDFITMDLTEAYAALGEITGEALEEDIIDKIFSEFCLGK